jgi:hypothetical protein
MEERAMKDGLRTRFYPEALTGVITALMFVVTLVRRDWIEALFAIDPDKGNGSVEWLIVGALLVATVALASLATHEWRRASAVAA